MTSIKSTVKKDLLYLVTTYKHLPYFRYDYARMTKNEIEEVTANAVRQCGPTYGRKMATGRIRSHGYNLGERVIRNAITEITPGYLHQRQRGTERLLNPTPYSAEYAGHKMHIDQNEKLGMFGAVEVVACDGYSGKILSWSVMPKKNNLTIYEDVYRMAGTEYGVFDTLRLDHGKEFNLAIFQQQKFQQLRTNTNRSTYIQTTSKLNHRVERVWVEVNARVNYPIKWALQGMVDDDLLDIGDPVAKYCISSMAIGCARISMQRFVSSWNAHSIPNVGIPNVLFQENLRTFRVPDSYFPHADVVCAEYEQCGGRITQPSVYGYDPLCNNIQLTTQRQMRMNTLYYMPTIVDYLVNRQPQYFIDAVHDYIAVTKHLAP